MKKKGKAKWVSLVEQAEAGVSLYNQLWEIVHRGDSLVITSGLEHEELVEYLTEAVTRFLTETFRAGVRTVGIKEIVEQVLFTLKLESVFQERPSMCGVE